MKWHILMTIKYKFTDKNFEGKLQSKELIRISQDIEKSLKSEQKSYKLIIEAIEKINSMIQQEGLDILDRKIFERKETTDKLIRFLLKK